MSHIDDLIQKYDKQIADLNADLYPSKMVASTG